MCQLHNGFESGWLNAFIQIHTEWVIKYKVKIKLLVQTIKLPVQTFKFFVQKIKFTVQTIKFCVQKIKILALVGQQFFYYKSSAVEMSWLEPWPTATVPSASSYNPYAGNHVKTISSLPRTATVGSTYLNHRTAHIPQSAAVSQPAHSMSGPAGPPQNY